MSISFTLLKLSWNSLISLKVYGYLGKGRKSNAGRKRKTGPKKRARQVAEDSEMEETVVHLDDAGEEEQQYLDGSLNGHIKQNSHNFITN